MHRTVQSYLVPLLLLVVAAGCSSSAKIAYPPGPGERTTTVYVTKRGWHTGIIVPKDSIVKNLPSVVDDFPKATHLNFSWGDGRYFMAEEGTFGLALRAALLPTQSVIHINGYDRLPKWYLEEPSVISLQLSDQGFQAMMSYIEHSFKRDQSDSLIVLRENREAMSWFYRSGITYWGTRTCNVWTARALKHAGLKTQPAFRLTARSLMRKLNKGAENQNQSQPQP